MANKHVLKSTNESNRQLTLTMVGLLIGIMLGVALTLVVIKNTGVDGALLGTL